MVDVDDPPTVTYYVTALTQYASLAPCAASGLSYAVFSVSPPSLALRIKKPLQLIPFVSKPGTTAPAVRRL